MISLLGAVATVVFAGACGEDKNPPSERNLPTAATVSAPVVSSSAPPKPAVLLASAVASANALRATLTAVVDTTDVSNLQSRALAIPVAGVQASALRDTFGDGRAQGQHEALDIAAPIGTAVHAVEDGVVVKLFSSARGGLTVYQFDPSGRYAYYYAHLDGYAPGLHEGQRVKRCDVIGRVGVTGNSPAGAPHLHFAIFKLEAQPRWWRGAAINPYLVLREPEASASPCPPGGG